MTTIDSRLKASLTLENCPAAVQSRKNAWLVNGKVCSCCCCRCNFFLTLYKHNNTNKSQLEKLTQFDAFVFFRGTAGFFDLDLMCSDGYYRTLENQPRVVSNGDARWFF